MTKDQAETVYRQAWREYVMTESWERRRDLGIIMDSMQSTIATRPGPEWDAFIDTLPGFREFWAIFGENAEKMIGHLK